MNKPARVYRHVLSEPETSRLDRKLKAEVEGSGYVIFAIYSEKAANSSTMVDRPALLRLLHDLNEGDTIIVEHLDLVMNLSLPVVKTFMSEIQKKGAWVSVPGLIDLPVAGDGVRAIVATGMQEMLLKIILHQCEQTWKQRV